jgi:hypothetical protein
MVAIEISPIIVGPGYSKNLRNSVMSGFLKENIILATTQHIMAMKPPHIIISPKILLIFFIMLLL